LSGLQLKASHFTALFRDDNTVLDSVKFMFAFMAINYIVTLPFNIYQTFELDREFGFSKMTPKLYIQDQLKSIAMFIILGVAIIALLSWIIINVPNWWIFGFPVPIWGELSLINCDISDFNLRPIFNTIYPPKRWGALQSSIEEDDGRSLG